MHGPNVLLQRRVRVAAQAAARGQRAAEAVRHAAHAAAAVKAAEKVGYLRLRLLLLLLLLLDGGRCLPAALLHPTAATADQRGGVAEWRVAVTAAGHPAAAAATSSCRLMQPKPSTIQLEPGGAKAPLCTAATCTQLRHMCGQHAVLPLDEALRGCRNIA